MKNLYVQKIKGVPVGWGFNGKLSLGETPGGVLERSHVGWIFSSELASHLKRLKRERAAATGKSEPDFKNR